MDDNVSVKYSEPEIDLKYAKEFPQVVGFYYTTGQKINFCNVNKSVTGHELYIYREILQEDVKDFVYEMQELEEQIEELNAKIVQCEEMIKREGGKCLKQSKVSSVKKRKKSF